MLVEFVVGSLLCSERFFSGCCGFPLCSKTNIYFDQELGRRRTTLWTTCAVVVLRVKVSCITSVDGIILWLLI